MAAEKYFNRVIDCPFDQLKNLEIRPGYTIRWFPESEEITKQEYDLINKAFWGIDANITHINNFSNFLRVHDKVAAFIIWSALGVNIPKYFVFNSLDDLKQKDLPYPIILRLNNSVAGQDSWKVNIPEELEAAYNNLYKSFISKRGINTKMIATQFIDTRHPDFPNHNVSYRVIVAGNKLVTGYARVSSGEDWVAVTNKFNKNTIDAWYFHNIKLQKMMEGNPGQFIYPVLDLGLNHQGIDVIPNFSNTEEVSLNFLEVQTTYDAGFATPDNKQGLGNYTLPYFNPYNESLKAFIEQNKAEMEQTMPLYTYNWLNKQQHFDECYKNLKEVL
jgi:hypothetical protein